jgi:hypothetical protein
MAKSSKLRTEAEHIYTLTDRLQVRLQVLEAKHVGVQMNIGVDFSKMPLEEAVVIMTMLISQDARDDLKELLVEMKETRMARAKLREKLQKSKASVQSEYDLEDMLPLLTTLYVKQLTAEVDELHNDLDSMSEMGEMESLRLQMAMDRVSKMMSTLSNLLKKISDTSSSIVQNLK